MTVGQKLRSWGVRDLIFQESLENNNFTASNHARANLIIRQIEPSCVDVYNWLTALKVGGCIHCNSA